MERKTLNRIGILALISFVLYIFWKRNSPKESRKILENKLAAALKVEDYEAAKIIRDKLKKYKN
jgi:uncharacterized membrane protein YsdA (DUF1294 family)